MMTEIFEDGGMDEYREAAKAKMRFGTAEEWALAAEMLKERPKPKPLVYYDENGERVEIGTVEINNDGQFELFVDDGRVPDFLKDRVDRYSLRARLDQLPETD